MRHAFLNCVIFISCFAITNLQAQPSGRTNFDKDWKFTLGKPDDMKTPQTPVSEWRSIDLPHDWSIEGEFNAKNPATNGGGSLPGGIGWYAKTLNIDSPLKANKLFIEFDGVYMNSTVWVNGYEVGTRPYGYATFQYDITPYLLAGNNSLLVRVDNSEQPNSRWYSGSGIYRHVWLIETPEIHFEQSGTYFTTPLITDKEATVNASASVLNETFEPANVELRVHIYDADGALVSEQRQTQMVTAKSGVTVSQQLKIANPHLWDVEHPYLYKAVTEIYKGNELQQSYGNNIGVRYFHFDADKGRM